MTSRADVAAAGAIAAPAAVSRTSPLRIVYLIDGMGEGGAQTHLVNLVTGLDPARFAPEVVYLAWGAGTARCLEERGYAITGYGLRRIYGIAAARRFASLVRRLRRVRPQVLHTYLSSSTVFGTAAALVARVPCLVTSRRESGLTDSPRMVRALALSNRWARRVVAVSRDCARVAQEREGLDPSRVTVIPNGIDVARFSRAGRRERARAALGLAPGVPLVLTVGHLTPVKGVDVLVEAAPRIQAALPPVVFAATGEGRSRDAIAARIAALGLSGAFRLLGVRTDVPDLLEAADLFVLPSRAEGQPNSLLEAMAMELPAVASRVGGVGEILDDGSEGLLVPPEDPAALADACVRVLRSPDAGRSLARAARRRVERDFSVATMVGRYEALYEDVVGVRR